MSDLLTTEQRCDYVTELLEWCKQYSSTADGNRIAMAIPTEVDTESLRVILNKLFPTGKCTEVKYTLNIDKMPFYIVVAPNINFELALAVVYGEYRSDTATKPFDVYRIEIDSKMFSDFTPGQMTASILYSIHYVLDPSIITKIKLAIDAAVIDNGILADKYIKMKDMEKNGNLFFYCILVFINQLSALSAPNEIEGLSNYQNLNVLDGAEAFKSAVAVVRKDTMYDYDLMDQTQHPAVQIFDWCISCLVEPENHANDIIHALREQQKFTGSQIISLQIERLINSILDITHDNMHHNSSIAESVISLSEGFSLFKSLKTNGLRSIEDDLYEYKIRIKNCEEQEEAMYILRQINTRMSIVDDYMRNTDISDRERERWEGVLDSYRDLRIELGKKKLGPKKQYGIFIDYDALDNM